MKKTVLFTVAFMALFLLCLGKASAHYLTVNVDNYFPGVGEEAVISLGMGHKFPETESVAVDKMERMYVVAPDGNEIPLEMKAVGDKKLVAPIRFKFEKPGTYTIVALKKKSFVTKTTEGYKYQPKNELENAVKSYWSEGNAKAVIVAGEPSGESYKHRIKGDYQIVLENDPGNVSKGEIMNVGTVMDCKPHSTQILSTYAGFSDLDETYAYATRSRNGSAEIKILEKGPWLIKIHDSFPYPDPEKADENSFTSSMTFGVK